MRIPQPVSKEEADKGGSFPVWKPGDYDFEVHDAADDRSKAGAEMIKLTLYVFDSDGNKRTVFDYLTADEKSQWKCRHFCEAVGLVAAYESGELDVYDITGKTGCLKLRVKAASGDYPANNSVQDYIVMEERLSRAAPRPAARPATEPHRPPTHNGGRAPTAAQRATADLDDEIPF